MGDVKITQFHPKMKSGLPVPPRGKSTGGYMWASEYKRLEFEARLIADPSLWLCTPAGKSGQPYPYTNKENNHE